jgi:hypothetical protein
MALWNYSYAMEEALEKVIGLRDQKLALISKNELEIASLQHSNDELRGQIDGLDEAIRVLSPPTPKPTSTLPGVGKYAKTKLTEAVLDVVSIHGAAPGLFVPEIIEKLIAEGCKSDADNFYASVYSTAMLLLKNGKIAEGKRDGKRAFMKK